MKSLYAYATSEGQRIFATSPKMAENYFQGKSEKFTATFQGKQFVKSTNLEKIAKGIYASL